jgi:hypothetical protein
MKQTAALYARVSTQHQEVSFQLYGKDRNPKVARIASPACGRAWIILLRSLDAELSPFALPAGHESFMLPMTFASPR